MLPPLRAVPFVPGISLHLAVEPVSFWEDVEAASGRTGTEPPFWAFAWAGGQALARYLLDNPSVVAGRRVVDIASGSGLVAIAAAVAGAGFVTAFDVDPLAIAAISANAAINGVCVAAECRDVLDASVDADLVLVADAFYTRELGGRVGRFLARCGVPYLVGDLGRTYLPRDLLAPVAVYDVPELGALEDQDMKRTTIWTAC
jgi:predicted nicotinamide N-methyase